MGGSVFALSCIVEALIFKYCLDFEKEKVMIRYVFSDDI